MPDSLLRLFASEGFTYTGDELLVIASDLMPVNASKRGRSDRMRSMKQEQQIARLIAGEVIDAQTLASVRIQVTRSLTDASNIIDQESAFYRKPPAWMARKTGNVIEILLWKD